MATDRTRVSMTITAVDPPFNRDHGVLFGLQSKSDVEDPVSASETTMFDLEIEVAHGDSAVDFFGPHVQGRRGDRFVYVSWGVPDETEPFVMFARAKIKFDTIPDGLVHQAIEQGQRLHAELQATNHKGQPASGTIRPPAVTWSLT